MQIQSLLLLLPLLACCCCGVSGGSGQQQRTAAAAVAAAVAVKCETPLICRSHWFIHNHDATAYSGHILFGVIFRANTNEKLDHVTIVYYLCT
jgi:hypothetical protein